MHGRLRYEDEQVRVQLRRTLTFRSNFFLIILHFRVGTRNLEALCLRQTCFCSREGVKKEQSGLQQKGRDGSARACRNAPGSRRGQDTSQQLHVVGRDEAGLAIVYSAFHQPSSNFSTTLMTLPTVSSSSCGVVGA